MGNVQNQQAAALANKIDNMISLEYYYLNGKKLDISLHDTKPPEPIPLSFIREHLKDIVPEDIIFIDGGGKIINKEDEDKIFTQEEGRYNLFYVYSDILLSQRNYEPKNVILNFKILEEKEEFNIYEYPNEEIKDDEQFYSIILLGDYYENIKFVNGYLNYIYDIQKEDKFRLKIEDIKDDNIKNENEKKFLKIYNIKHEKGNFKFYCFYFGAENEINMEEINELEKVLINDNKDIHIDFIAYNKLNYTYRTRFKNEIFLNRISEIGEQISKKDYKGINSNFFFLGPNNIHSDIMFELRTCIVESYGEQKPDNIFDKCKRELEEKYKNVILYYSFCDYNTIYETKNDKLQICEFNRVMDGFSKFHNGLINAPRNFQFNEIRKYFISLIEIFKPLNLKYKDMKKKNKI